MAVYKSTHQLIGVKLGTLSPDGTITGLTEIQSPRTLEFKPTDNGDPIFPLKFNADSFTVSGTVTFTPQQSARFMLLFGMWTLTQYIEWFYPQAKQARSN